MLEHLALGFSVVLSPDNLLYCFVGCLLGTLIGVLPGIGPLATIALLLPLTFGIPPESGLIMLAGIFYGAQYGGSTTAILLNLPGEVTSVATAIDGHQMARQGRGGIALATAALGSFFAGCVATAVVAWMGPLLVEAALGLKPADYFAVMVAGLVTSVAIGSGSVPRGVAMVVLGILLGLVGRDPTSGTPRMVMGLPELEDGINFVALVMGLFGVADIFWNIAAAQPRVFLDQGVSGLIPSRRDLRDAAPAAVRGTVLGCLAGLLPGSGVTLGAFGAYMFEKRLARDPSRFGRGAIEGVAAPEAANNAAAQTAFIPLLSLGIPGNPVMAVMIGALIVHNIAPGPLLMEQQPRLFWGVIASMWIGNLMLVIINLPLVGLWVKMLRIPYRYLFPAILVFCAIGAYSINTRGFDVIVMLLAGLAGFALRRLRFEPAPLVLGFVLGPMMEDHLRRALLIGRGDPLVLVSTPVSAVFLGLSAVMLAVLMLPRVRRNRDEIFTETED